MLFENRTRAESFGAIATSYDRARPSYPPALIDALVSPGVERVVDVGCGTGIASALLAERGCSVLGIEVDPRMAQLARQKGIEVEVARFEDWDPRGRSFDLLTSAQAWHWVDPQAGAARAADALRKGGRIAVFWNFGDPEAPLNDLLCPIYSSLAPEIGASSPLFGKRVERVDAACAGIAASGAFEPPQVESFRWAKRYDTSSWLDQLGTYSDHKALPQERREELLAAIAEAIDSIGGDFEMAYEALLVSALRR